MFKRALPHFCIIFSLMVIAVYITDLFNSAINFINNDIFKAILVAYSVGVFILSVMAAARNRKDLS